MGIIVFIILLFEKLNFKKYEILSKLNESIILNQWLFQWSPLFLYQTSFSLLDSASGLTHLYYCALISFHFPANQENVHGFLMNYEVFMYRQDWYSSKPNRRYLPRRNENSYSYKNMYVATQMPVSWQVGKHFVVYLNKGILLGKGMDYWYILQHALISKDYVK